MTALWKSPVFRAAGLFVAALLALPQIELAGASDQIGHAGGAEQLAIELEAARMQRA